MCREVADKDAAEFTADKTRNLIVRLQFNVIRAGLRRINLAYSRISLADVATRLGDLLRHASVLPVCLALHSLILPLPARSYDLGCEGRCFTSKSSMHIHTLPSLCCMPT